MSRIARRAAAVVARLRRLRAEQKGGVLIIFAFAGLYQLSHELIVRAVVEGTELFFGKRLIDGGWDFGEEEYKTKVLSRHRVPFKACLDWLVEMDALTDAQASRLDDIYFHRNDLTHELMKYIVDPHLDPDVGLFLGALAIVKALSRFWIQMQADMGSYDHFAHLNVDEVESYTIFMLEICIGAYLEGLSTP